MGLLLRTRVKTIGHGVEKHGLSGEGKVPGKAVSKEVHADNALRHERTHHY